MERLTVVSADAHAGADPEMYLEYLEPAFRDRIPDLVAENKMFISFEEQAASSKAAGGSRAALSILDDDDAISSGAGTVGAWDMARRLEQMDREGIAAEVVLPGVTTAVMPFFSAGNMPHPPELRAAGARAYHRWLHDATEVGRGRFFPIAAVSPHGDLAASLRELEWAAEHGFVGVHVPGETNDGAMPPLWDRYYEPFFAACAELGFVMVMHAGYGLEQGSFIKMLDDMGELLARSDLTDEEKRAEMRKDPFFNIRATRYRRAFWQLLLGGLFDRHPTLRLCFTELGADWVRPVLAIMDERYAVGDTPLTRSPSSYWTTNCGVVASSIRRVEVEQREEIGIDQLMFGTDFPHPEGTWPNTNDWLRAALTGVPEADVRKIVGENAIRFFGLDAAALAPIAARIGPTLDELTAGPAVDPQRLAAFDARGSFSLPARPVEAEPLVVAFDEDVRQLAGA
jgi:predicted TIM-barrel fold metal-dependent hydrolase